MKSGKEYSPHSIGNIASSGARGRNIDPSQLKSLSLQDNFVIRAGQALKLMDDLLENSVLHNETHGTHCSALASRENIIVLREDIGRHNTIDMLGGYALLKQIDLSATVILGSINAHATCALKYARAAATKSKIYLSSFGPSPPCLD